MSRGVARVLSCWLIVLSVMGCAARPSAEVELYRFWQGGNVGYMDVSGQVVIPATFHQGQDFYEGQAVVVVDAREWSGQWAVIDREGSFLVEPSNDHPVRFFEGRWLMNRGGVHRYGGGTVWWGDEWFLADAAGRPVGDGAIYEELLSLQGGRAAVKVGDVWGYLDRDGEMAVAPQYRRGSYFHDGVVVMCEEGGYGVLNAEGEWVVEPTFDQMSLQFKDGLAFAVEAERWGVIDTAGEWVRTFDLPKPRELNGRLARLRCELPDWFKPAFPYWRLPYPLVNHAGRQSDYWVPADASFYRDGLLAIIRDG